MAEEAEAEAQEKVMAEAGGMEEGGAGEGDGKGEIRPRKMRRRSSERVPRRSERGRPWRRRQRRRTKRKAGTVDTYYFKGNSEHFQGSPYSSDKMCPF
jgi:hypothetical protein